MEENKKSSMSLNLLMGARNGASNVREENDFYATSPACVESFLNQLREDNLIISKDILEPCAGNGHISETLKKNGYNVLSWDLVQRDYPLDNVGDFLSNETKNMPRDILTNPPFKIAEAFVKHGLDMLEIGHKVIMLMKIQFLEGESRYAHLFKNGSLKYVYVHVARQHTAMNGEFEKYNAKTQCYAWYIFEKGYQGPTELRWIHS